MASDSENSGEITLHVEIANADNSENIDLADFWLAVIRRSWFILAVSVPFVLLAVALALLLPQYYQSSVLMAHAESDSQNSNALAGLMGQFGGLSALGGLSGSGSSEGDQAIAILNSRAFSKRFIDEQNLMPVLFAKKWDKDKKRWQSLPEKKIPTISDGIKKFNDKVRNVSTNKLNGLITLTVEWKDPQIAAAWANSMVEMANRTLKQAAIVDAEKNLLYLNQELEKTRVTDLKNVIYSLVEIQMNKIMLANTREQYAFKVIDPATPAEPEDESRPNRKLIVVMGGLLGVFVGFLLVVSREWRLRAN